LFSSLLLTSSSSLWLHSGHVPAVAWVKAAKLTGNSLGLTSGSRLPWAFLLDFLLLFDQDK
jgi:hypothetical protein